MEVTPMKTEIVLDAMPTYTQYVPLAVLGYCLTRTRFLQQVWSQIELGSKAYDHTPAEKLQDALLCMLAGLGSISKINTRLRPDQTLAQAWERDEFAEQSTIARVLDSLGQEQVEQLRQGHQSLFRSYSQTMKHDYHNSWLMIDIDPTGLLASRHAEGSRKGYVAGQVNHYNRQLARVSVPTYHENLYSFLYPGNQQGATMVKPAVKTIQEFLGLGPEQRPRVIIRSDASLGTDGNINWLLWLNYQILMKGFSGSRAVKLAKRVAEQDWLEDPARKRWIALAPDPPRFARRIQVFSLKWQGKSKIRYGTLLSTLFQLEPLPTFRLHDGRGAMEIEIRSDKQGLKLPKRRKHRFAAQEALVLLTDLAHNLLSWIHHWVMVDTDFADFGTQRMVEELLCIPGRVEIEENMLKKVSLLESHPYAPSMRQILQNLLNFFGYP